MKNYLSVKKIKNHMSIWNAKVLHTEKLALRLWGGKVTYFRMNVS